MSEPIPVKEALRLIEMALMDAAERYGRQSGCEGKHRGSCGEGLHHHHDQDCWPDELARATMRPMLEYFKFGPWPRVEVHPTDSMYPPLAALKAHYDRVRPDWRTK